MPEAVDARERDFVRRESGGVQTQVGVSGGEVSPERHVSRRPRLEWGFGPSVGERGLGHLKRDTESNDRLKANE